jgi:imidazolonepropionase-like amidohydrolase
MMQHPISSTSRRVALRAAWLYDGTTSALRPRTAEALRSATSTGAVVCGLGDRKGRIAEGYDADILAIDGDPLTDPSTLHAIRAVILRGERLR